ncbi:blr2472 [Bradyrhizobium diazoefficiens USDA 110]|uniref:Blr2472 protein n=4 Tax=Bradyrhizobium diazoefficiens TaxID=1355477 RepID=Q89SC8_BRADU|nr:hypothetical protein [Bradyrhizobium diazoefficiens]MBP1095072.1 hypothetical protein [Bradyrhizobium japonicum]PDT56778.1 hypothetical protein CO678_37080 [Bradyrhizobium diazoefficiens]QBP21302.1 hypothetical protein Bdiaspc4_12695 [Bradyrhizobium diazoefficiens]WLA72062.1 hypothetical protein QIH77_35015 [Bradyrhizobium diazoefficiens]BAC47737.1 blr2472 [Bradyrhizobium diazoefficiens USDA 110]
MNVPALLIPEDLIDRGARSDRSVATTVFALLAIASLLPTLLTPIPAMVDYLNHLARMYLLSQMGTANANPYYQAAWAFYPNLAMDLVVPPMARLIGAENATRLFLLFGQLLIIGGALALEWVVKRRVHLAGFAALLFLYCLPFTWGFVNFECALGIALWGIAAYLFAAEQPTPVRFAVNTAFVVVLFAAHFFSLGIYGATLGFYELWRAFDRKLPYRDAALRLVTLAIPAVALLVVMRLTAGSVGSEGTFWYFDYKLLWPFFIMNGYSMAVSGASALVLMAALYVAARCGMLKLQPAGIWVATGFALLYLAIPPRLFGTAFADIRVLPAAALILPAFCSLSLPSRRWTMAALAIVGGITLANLAVVLVVWLSYRGDYSAFIRSFQKIDRGSKILIGTSGEGDDPPFKDLTQYPMYYAPTLAVHYANAFVPNVFAEAGKQPVQARTEVRRLAIPYGGPVPIRLLSAIAAGQMTASDDAAFIRTWYRDYNYLYLLGTGVANPLPDMLKELDRSERFVLYKIRRTP